MTGGTVRIAVIYLARLTNLWTCYSSRIYRTHSDLLMSTVHCISKSAGLSDMHESSTELKRSRAILIATLTILLFVLTVSVVGDVILLVLASHESTRWPEAGTFGWFTAACTVLLGVVWYARHRLVITPVDVAKHLRELGFTTVVMRRRLEAKRANTRVSLFLETTRRAYSFHPTWHILKRNGRLVAERIGSYDPSYMYNEGVLRVYRYDDVAKPIDLELCVTHRVDVDDIPRQATILASKRVGAWMGHHLLEELDAIVNDAAGG